METSLASIEASQDKLDDIITIVAKISKRVKYWVPIVGAAAVSSGIVSGKWGAFFHALFQ